MGTEPSGRDLVTVAGVDAGTIAVCQAGEPPNDPTMHINAEPGARSSETAHHFIRYQQDAVPVADLAQSLHKGNRRDHVAALPDDLLQRPRKVPQ